MTPELTLAELLAFLSDDRDLLDRLHEEGILMSPLERAYSKEEAEHARVARVLVREMDVNLAGVDIILHMRRQILALRSRMIDLMEELQKIHRQP